jgi:hypothetical protein
MIKLSLILMLFHVTVNEPALSNVLQHFDKHSFYNVMETGNVNAIDQEITTIEAAGIIEKDGYEGALLMKKAGMVAPPKEKLKFFKAGRIKFEKAMQADSNNTEFRFLRLTIQENAPKIVKYRNNLVTDKAFVVSHFQRLPLAVQDAIKQYSKRSKIIKPVDIDGSR